MAASGFSKTKGVSNVTPKMPTDRPALYEPNAKDNPDCLAPENPLKQALGGSGKPPAPFGKQGREF